MCFGLDLENIAYQHIPSPYKHGAKQMKLTEIYQCNRGKFDFTLCDEMSSIIHKVKQTGAKNVSWKLEGYDKNCSCQGTSGINKKHYRLALYADIAISEHEKEVNKIIENLKGEGK